MSLLFQVLINRQNMLGYQKYFHALSKVFEPDDYARE